MSAFLLQAKVILMLNRSHYLVSNPSTVEGLSLDFKITRSGFLDQDETVYLWTLARGTNDGDYEDIARGTPLKFAAGENSKIIKIPTYLDSIYEDPELVDLYVYRDINRPQINSVSGTGTIYNSVQYTITSYNAYEGEALKFAIRRAGTTDNPIEKTLYVKGVSGSAIEGLDFASDGYTAVTFARGSTFLWHEVATYRDTLLEGAEVMSLNLYATPQGGPLLASANATIIDRVNSRPTGGVMIHGTATQGQVLRLSNTLADVDGLGTITYQWRSNGNNISGATGSSFTLTQAEVGKAITVVASYTDQLGTAESVVSEASASVVNINDAPTGFVPVSDTPSQGGDPTSPDTQKDLDVEGPIDRNPSSSSPTVQPEIQQVAITVPIDRIESIGFTPDGKFLVIKTNGVSKTVGIDDMLTFSDVSSSAQALSQSMTATPVFSSVVNGQAQYILPDFFTGPESLNLKYQLIDDTRNAVVIGSADNDFIKLSDANSAGKAVDGGGGNDVIDGGVGSTFISGGGGSNTFFLDGRASGVSWSTITDFTIGVDKATIWGWKQGISKVALIEEFGGATGYKGLTLHFENLLPSDASITSRNSNLNSITFSDKTLSDFGVSSVEALNAQIAAGDNQFFMTGQTVDDFGTHGYLHIA